MRVSVGFLLASSACWFLLLALAGCATTKNTQFREAYDGKVWPPKCMAPCTDSFERIADRSESTHAAYMATIEFDDQGYLYDRVSKNMILERIQEEANQAPLLLIVFAHGWQHNAGPKDSNVADFEKILSRIAEVDAAVCRSPTSECRRREVIGLYLGWRGLYFEHEPLKTLSFWSRKSRAHRVGIDGATEVIAQLSAIRFGRDAGATDNGEENRLILVGHSFGAALIYSATQQILMRDMFAQDSSGKVPATLADLVVLVNPAFEAARFHALHARMKALEASKTGFPQAQLPIFAVFTSTSDDATDRLFHMGRGLSTFWMPVTGRLNDGIDGSTTNQHAENTTSLGKFEPWVTHTLERSHVATTHGKPSPSDKVSGCSDEIPTAEFIGFFSEAICAWRRFASGKEKVWKAGDTILRRTDEPVPGHGQNPYMLVKVENEVICGHSGIWGSSFSEFLYEFIAARDARVDRCAEIQSDE